MFKKYLFVIFCLSNFLFCSPQDDFNREIANAEAEIKKSENKQKFDQKLDKCNAPQIINNLKEAAKHYENAANYFSKAKNIAVNAKSNDIANQIQKNIDIIRGNSKTKLDEANNLQKQIDSIYKPAQTDRTNHANNAQEKEKQAQKKWNEAKEISTSSETEFSSLCQETIDLFQEVIANRIEEAKHCREMCEKNSALEAEKKAKNSEAVILEIRSQMAKKMAQNRKKEGQFSEAARLYFEASSYIKESKNITYQNYKKTEEEENLKQAHESFEMLKKQLWSNVNDAKSNIPKDHSQEKYLDWIKTLSLAFGKEASWLSFQHKINGDKNKKDLAKAKHFIKKWLDLKELEKTISEKEKKATTLEDKLSLYDKKIAALKTKEKLLSSVETKARKEADQLHDLKEDFLQFLDDANVKFTTNLNELKNLRDAILNEIEEKKILNFHKWQKNKKIHPRANFKRFHRGSGNTIATCPFIVPISGQKGIPIADHGDNKHIFTNNPWFLRVKKEKRKYLTNSKHDEFYFQEFENPASTFGESAGGSPLYTGKGYSFGVYGGELFWLDHTSPNDYQNIKLLIKVYDKKSFQNGAQNVEPIHIEPIFIPLKRLSDRWTELKSETMDSLWEEEYLLKSGEAFIPSNNLKQKYGLETKISYTGSSTSWDTDIYDSGIIITHKSSTTNYCFIVEIKGYLAIEDKVVDLTINDKYPEPKTKEEFLETFSSLYAIDFTPSVTSQANFIENSQFYDEASPANYMYIEEIFMKAEDNDLLCTNIKEDIKKYKFEQEEYSPEIYPHSILDQFVKDMGNNPLALTAYVQNEIELINGLSLPTEKLSELTLESILTSENSSIYPGNIHRSAIGTFLEKQGSPWEQCALLVYLLRKAGYAAAYVEGSSIMTKKRMSQILKMQIVNAVNSDGEVINAQWGKYNNIIEIKYPWVALYDEKTGKCIQLFPWIKNVKVEEGNDLYNYMPSGYKSATQWIRRYLENDPQIMKYVDPKDGNDTAAILFKKFVEDALRKQGKSFNTVGVRYINQKKQFNTWDDFPRPLKITNLDKTTSSLKERPELFATLQVEVYSKLNPDKKLITKKMRVSDIHNRNLYVYFDANSSDPIETKHKMYLKMAPFDYSCKHDQIGNFEGENLLSTQEKFILLDENDKTIDIKVLYDQNLNVIENLFNYFPNISITPSQEVIRPIDKGVLATICTNYGRVTKEMIEVHAEKFRNSKGTASIHEKQSTLAFLAGLSYYEKINSGDKILKDLHKIYNTTSYTIGLSKLSPDLTEKSPNLRNNKFVGQPILRYPQVDMLIFNLKSFGNNGIRPDLGNEGTAVYRDYFYLVIADGSSNEHQILNDFYNDHHAISTVKLLQLAHRRHVNSGREGTGFLTFTRETIRDVNISPDLAKNKYFSHFGTDFNISKIRKESKSQWNALCGGLAWDLEKNQFDKSKLGSFHSLAYMTPGVVHSDNGDPNDPNNLPSYKGMGTLIFTPTELNALISTNETFMNGGYGSKVPEETFTSSYIDNLNIEQDSSGAFSVDGIGAEGNVFNQYHQELQDTQFDWRENVPTVDYNMDQAYIEDVQGIAEDIMEDVKMGYIDPEEAMPIYKELTNDDYFSDDFADKIQNQAFENAFDKVFTMQENWFEGDSMFTNEQEFSGSAFEQMLFETESFFAEDSFLPQDVFPEDKSAENIVADPVDVVTGNFYINSADISIAGQFPLEIKRNYSSANPIKGDFGYGWKRNIISYLVLSAKNENNERGKYINAAEMDGTVIVYTKKKNENIWTVDEKKNQDLTNDQNRENRSFNKRKNWIEKKGDKYILHGSDGSERIYQVKEYPIKKLTRKRPYLILWSDSNGNQLHFEYGEDKERASYGNIRRIKNGGGSFIGFKYNENGLISEAYSSDGRRVFYQYNASLDLIKVKLPDDSEITYQYEQHIDEKKDMRYSTHRIVQEKKPNDRTIENVYDDKGRVIEQRSTVGKGLKTIPSSFFSYVKDETPENPISIREVKDVFGNITTYKIYKKMLFAIIDPLSNKTLQSWFLSKNKDGISEYFDAEKEIVLQVENENNFYPNSIKKKVDKLGLITEYNYDKNGNVSRITKTGKDLSGNGSLSKISTNYKYNSLNLPTEIKEENDTTIIYYESEEFPYLPTKLEQACKSSLVSKTVFEYCSKGPSKGLLQRTTSYDGNDNIKTDLIFENSENGFPTKRIQKSLSDSPDVIDHFIYGKSGNLVKQTNELGFSICYDYDIMERLTGIRYLDNEENPIAWNFNYYNENGDLEWTQGSRYNPVDYMLNKYDSAGRIIFNARWRAQPRENGEIESIPGADQFVQQAITLFEYDSFGNLIRSFDPEGNITKMSYNALGKVTRKTISNEGKDNVILDESYEYNKGGLLTKIIHTDQTTTSFEYTTNELVKRKANPNGTENIFIYDERGRIVKQKLPYSGWWEVSYDDANNTIVNKHTETGIEEKSTYDINGNLIKFINGEGFVFIKEYDGLGRLKREMGPNSDLDIITYDYLLDSTKYKEGNETVEITNQLQDRLILTYDIVSRLVSREFFNASEVDSCRQTRYVYCDDHHCQKTIEGYDQDTTVFKSFVNNLGDISSDCIYTPERSDFLCHSLYYYDRIGNLSTKLNTAGRYQFGHDALSQMTSKQVPGGALTNYTYGQNGEISSIQMPNDLSFSNIYSPFGKTSESITTENNESRKFEYEYYKSGQTKGLVSKIHTPNGITHSYSYDNLGRIVTIKTTNQTKNYTYDNRGLVTSIEEISSENTSRVEREYDCYGRTIRETTYLNNESISDWSQTWDLAGRRSSLTENSKGSSRSFYYDAEGKMTSTRVGNDDSLSWKYSYSTDGLLKKRSSPWSDTFIKYDYSGRPINFSTSSNDEIKIDQQFAWNYLDQLLEYLIVQNEKNHYHKYDYSLQGFLTKDENESPAEIKTFNYEFDFGNEDGLGILSGVNFDSQKNPEEESCESTPPLSFKFPPNCFNDKIYLECSEGDQKEKYKYDKSGNLIHMEDGNGKEYSLWWTDFGLLKKIIRKGSGGYVWEAIYDGLGRRIQTKYTTHRDKEEAITITSYFDPEVEFLELGLEVKCQNQTKTIWKIYGPDIDGSYGGMQGTGGLEAVIEGEKVTGIINDYFGNIIALIKKEHDRWILEETPNLPSYYGPDVHAINLLSYPKDLNNLSTNTILSMTWRGRRMDPTGFINLGARYYNPKTHRFISADPLGHESTPDLYTFAAGDPVNNFDPDGRIVPQAIGAVVGGATGLITQGITDLIKGERSSWTEYSGSFVGGATTGVLLTTTFNPAIASAAGSAAGNLIKQGLNKAVYKEKFDTVNLGKDIAKGFAIGKLSKFVPTNIKGITTGRGSFGQVYKQITTKLSKGTIKKVSNKSIGKMGGYIGVRDSVPTVAAHTAVEVADKLTDKLIADLTNKEEINEPTGKSQK